MLSNRRCDSAAMLTMPAAEVVKVKASHADEGSEGCCGPAAASSKHHQNAEPQAAGAHGPQQPQQQPAPHAAGDHPLRCCLQPAEIYEHIADGGKAKHRNSLLKEVVLGLMAGAFICFGFATCMLAAGQIKEETRLDNPGMFNLLFGAYGFPVGLSMCVINGASLFTSNIAYMSAAWMEGRATAWQALRVVWLSYFTNLAGCLFLVALMVSGDVFTHRESFTVHLALKKTSGSFGATVTRGILCNWLVCMAVWQGNAAQDVTGKLLGIWFPISAFVTSGYEHCVANMFVIPLGMALGAPISVRTFLVRNLIPATIGNLIGGGVFVAMAMALSFGSWERAINDAGARLYRRLHGPACGLACFGAAPAAPAPAAAQGGKGTAGAAAAAVAAAAAPAAARAKRGGSGLKDASGASSSSASSSSSQLCASDSEDGVAAAHVLVKKLAASAPAPAPVAARAVAACEGACACNGSCIKSAAPHPAAV